MVHVSRNAPATRAQRLMEASRQGDDYAEIDRWPRDLRVLVHEHGLNVVRAFLEVGIENPNIIRHLINVVRLGAREAGNRSAFIKRHGDRWLQSLDAALTDAGGPAMARQLVAMLRTSGASVLPCEPHTNDIEAVLAERGLGRTISPDLLRACVREVNRRRDRALWG